MAAEAPEPAAGSPARLLLECVFGNSPYLSRLILRDTSYAVRLFEEGPDALWQDIMAKVGSEVPRIATMSELMTALRKAKERAALVTAIADITNVWSVERVTGALSEFARLSVSLAASHLLRQRMISGDLAWPENTKMQLSLT